LNLVFVGYLYFLYKTHEHCLQHADTTSFRLRQSMTITDMPSKGQSVANKTIYYPIRSTFW